MRRRTVIIGMLAGILASFSMVAGSAAYPNTADITITTRGVDRAGNAVIDFEYRCDVAQSVFWSVNVRQYPKKGPVAYGSAGAVQAYVCLPGTPMTPSHSDQFVVNGAVLIQPGLGDTYPSSRFAAGYATVGINIWWTECPGATTMQACWDYIDGYDDPATEEDVETPPGDAFWHYEVVKLVRTR